MNRNTYMVSNSWVWGRVNALPTHPTAETTEPHVRPLPWSCAQFIAASAGPYGFLPTALHSVE